MDDLPCFPATLLPWRIGGIKVSPTAHCRFGWCFAGLPRNGDLIRDMAAMGDVPVQVGGGIRSEDIIEAILLRVFRD